MFTININKTENISFIRLGYVSLLFKIEFAKKVGLIGFDIKIERIGPIQKGIDPSKELDNDDLSGTRILFTPNTEELRQTAYHILPVPTIIDKYNQSDLSPLLAATRTLESIPKKGYNVFYKSTAFLDCTEENCMPIIQQPSGLKMGAELEVGYSPNLINPSYIPNSLPSIQKVKKTRDYCLEYIEKQRLEEACELN
jgi:UDP-N-acetyl-D-glucosamine/UDP-N-acetyl-D-galactosamine dehydrogenase